MEGGEQAERRLDASGVAVLAAQQQDGEHRPADEARPQVGPQLHVDPAGRRQRRRQRRRRRAADEEVVQHAACNARTATRAYTQSGHSLHTLATGNTPGQGLHTLATGTHWLLETLRVKAYTHWTESGHTGYWKHFGQIRGQFLVRCHPGFPT